MSDPPRAPRVLVLAHTGRVEARRGACLRLKSADRARHRRTAARGRGSRPGSRRTVDGGRDDRPTSRREGYELVIVIGGDGRILRAAELTHATRRRCSGSTSATWDSWPRPSRRTSSRPSRRSSSQRYTTEDRLTLDVGVRGQGAVYSTFALNEASVEKAARERMLEVVVEVDGRPLSRWGCDGVVARPRPARRPTTSGAGGPMAWPEVEALLMVPLSAHALFARPMVVAPRGAGRRGAVQHRGIRVLWCDGRRTVDLPPGARIEVRRGAGRCASSGCTTRRSPTGWWPSSTCPSRVARCCRAPAPGQRGRRMLEELRISQLGVIESSTPSSDRA